MVTGSNLRESHHAIELAKQYRKPKPKHLFVAVSNIFLAGVCFATVGVHPCSTQDFENCQGGPDALIKEIRSLTIEAQESGLAVAFGEIGLDYDRLFLSPKETQLKYFELQLDLAEELSLPLFLHSRACSDDFEKNISARLDKLPKRGLVHSFTGTIAEMESLLRLGFHIGINGCSMKTEENLEVVKAVPLDRLQIETDGPWCEIRASHASSQHLKDGPAVPKAVKKEKWQKGLMVKGRNEPATIVQVAHVIARVKGISVEEVCQAAWKNSTEMFGLGV